MSTQSYIPVLSVNDKTGNVVIEIGDIPFLGSALGDRVINGNNNQQVLINVPDLEDIILDGQVRVSKDLIMGNDSTIFTRSITAFSSSQLDIFTDASRVTLYPSGNMHLGNSVSDQGYKLWVNGQTRLNGDLTLNGRIVQNSTTGSAHLINMTNGSFAFYAKTTGSGLFGMYLESTNTSSSSSIVIQMVNNNGIVFQIWTDPTSGIYNPGGTAIDFIKGHALFTNRDTTKEFRWGWSLPLPSPVMSLSSAGLLTVNGLISTKNIQTQLSTKTANYTANINDNVILADCSSGSVTITLPAVDVAFTGGKSYHFTIKKVDVTYNPLIINVTGGSQIETSTSISIIDPGVAYTLISNGVKYYIV